MQNIKDTKYEFVGKLHMTIAGDITKPGSKGFQRIKMIKDQLDTAGLTLSTLKNMSFWRTLVMKVEYNNVLWDWITGNEFDSNVRRFYSKN